MFTLLPMALGDMKIKPGAEYPLGAPASVSTTARSRLGAMPYRSVKNAMARANSSPYAPAIVRRIAEMRVVETPPELMVLPESARTTARLPGKRGLGELASDWRSCRPERAHVGFDSAA